jgi:hypothetical protein
MEMSSYEKIKDFIYKKLQEVEGTLPKDKISYEIENTKTLMNAMPLEMFARVLSVDSVSKLSEADWTMMAREFETLFDVQMDSGILIQGEEQQKRDTIWWTSKAKQKSENYYWNRYKEYSKKSLPFEVVKTLDVDTDRIMNNIEDPQKDDFAIYGMVVGHVQSGKTGNYSGLICKAADAGYKFIVVIAGSINNLRDQTQERLNKSFIGEDLGVPVGVGKLGRRLKKYLPVSLTTKVLDFNKQDANKNKQGINFDNISTPIVMVIKKNTKTLDNVIDWLQEQYKNQKIANHAMLLIDDESDYASINTKGENDPTKINEKIRKLLSLFRKSAYVAYTATPYANIFIDHNVNTDALGMDLFPRDFIYALDAPTNYFGARKIFLDTNFKHIVEIEEPANLKLKHKKDTDVTYLPDNLKDAIRLFIINIGIRWLRNQKSKHNSMLIHASRFTMVHQKISLCVEDYVSELRRDILAYASLKDAELQSINIGEIRETFETHCKEVEFPWKKVLKSINSAIETVIIREVHQNKSVELEYRDDRPTNAIVIGGTSLARGFTLEGLSVSYFLRTTVFYDTLMQMARWFGYRPNYEDLCKIYITKEMKRNFQLIIEATEDLFDDFKRMEKEKKTPRDFGLAVRQHPDSGLQVTARNKQKNSKDYTFEMKLDGSAKETSWLLADEHIRRKNLEVIRNTVINLLRKYGKGIEIKKSYLWKNVSREIVSKFLHEFEVYKEDQFGIKSRMPIDFVKKYVEDINTEWDIAIYSGEGREYAITDNIKIFKESRKVELHEGYYEIQNRQVSSGTSESIALPEESRKRLGSNRKEIRQELERPLLMLHILETIEDHELAAFGISFPGGINSCGKTVVLKINSVYIEKLLNEEVYDD